MGCIKSCVCHKKRCCHCRPQTAVPNDEIIDENNINEIVNAKKYNKWIKHTQVNETRKWFYWLTFYVDIYCWVMIIGNGLGIFFAHFFPIAHLIDSDIKPWGTCKYFDETGKSGYAIGCILEFHAFNVPVICGIIGLCTYTLIKWNYDNIALFEKIIMISNILEFGYMIYEALVCWIVFIRNDEWYQTWLIFALGVLISTGVILGIWIQFKIFLFFQKTNTYKLQYPKSESEIVSLVRESYVDHGKIRVVGSKHSCPNAIYVNDVFAQNEIMISLDYYTGIRIVEVNDNSGDDDGDDGDDEKSHSKKVKHRAIVKGGTCLGLNRLNPLSSKSNGLVYELQRKGYALYDLGGVVMQTVGGFTAMGCAGGSLYNDYYESIHSIRIITGKGDIKTYVKPTLIEDPNYEKPYWGVIVSMGLMGIISEVTFDLQETYNVLGSQIVWSTPDWLNENKCVAKKQKNDDGQPIGDATGSLDIFADNNDVPNSLYQVMGSEENRHKCEYFRLFVWPQVHPNLVTVWKGHRELKTDSTCPEWSDCYGKNGKFKDVYYYEVDKGKKGVLEQKVLSVLYNFFDHLTSINTMELPNWACKTIQFLVKQVNETGNKAAQFFGAPWSDIIPMDQEMHTKLLPMQFTELWVDFEDTSKVMKLLKEFWSKKNNGGFKHTGTFSWEFYPAKAGGYEEKPGGAWIRPSFGRRSFRIDVLWFDIKTDIPYNFFSQLWDFLVKNDVMFRPHWAKWFAGGNVKFPKKSKLSSKYKKWNDYYADQYPKWKDWHDLRNKLDPHNVFLSTYWADSLNIQVPKESDDNHDDGEGDGDGSKIHEEMELHTHTD